MKSQTRESKKLLKSINPHKKYCESRASRILDYLYLGGVANTTIEELEYFKIEAVISLGDTSEYTVHESISYLLIDIDDEANENIYQYFHQTIDFINSHSDKILIHCHAGKSRSVTIVVAYLMYQHRWSLQESLDYVKNIRSCVGPNYGFMQQLKQFEAELGISPK